MDETFSDEDLKFVAELVVEEDISSLTWVLLFYFKLGIDILFRFQVGIFPEETFVQIVQGAAHKITFLK